MAGMTSPARPWFRLTTSDDSLDEHHSVKEWLSDTRKLMLRVFAKGNHYRALHSVYDELGVFGTAANLIVPHFERVQHNFTFTAGEYAIATDFEGMVNAFYREVDIRVGALVGEFGRENCSSTVRSMFDRGMLDSWVTMIHGIEPRAERDPRPKTPRTCRSSRATSRRARRRASICARAGTSASGWSRRAGTRWAATSTATRPAWKRWATSSSCSTSSCARARASTSRPSRRSACRRRRRQAGRPAAGRGHFFNTAEPSTGSRQMFEARIDLNHLLADIQDVRQRINSAFFADLFLMLTQLDQSGMTATEVAERHEEKMLVLGPVLEQLHFELLSPMVQMCFEDLLEAGAIPAAAARDAGPAAQHRVRVGAGPGAARDRHPGHRPLRRQSRRRRGLQARRARQVQQRQVGRHLFGPAWASTPS
jgi:hypothetical protein